MEKREILFCNLTVNNVKKNVVIKNCVILKGDENYKKQKIVKTEIIKSLGFESKKEGHVEALKSDEKRNNITGAYD